MNDLCAIIWPYLINMHHGIYNAIVGFVLYFSNYKPQLRSALNSLNLLSDNYYRKLYHKLHLFYHPQSQPKVLASLNEIR